MKKIKKSDSYKVGVCGIRAQLQDKQKAIDFESDKVIEVTDEQFKIINALGWCVEVKENGSSTENTNKESKNRVTSTVENK